MLRYLLPVAFGIAPQMCVEAQSAVSPIYISNQTVTFSIEDSDIRGVIDALRKHLPVPICFEMETLDPKLHAITAREALRHLQKKQTLTNGEKSELNQLLTVCESYPDSIVDWKLPRYTFHFNSETPDKILTKIFSEINSYQIKWDNSYLIVYPRENTLLQFPVTGISVHNKTIRDALKPLEPKFDELKISAGVDLMSVFQPNDLLSNPVSTLEIKEQIPAMVFLNRVAQASSPPCFWSLLGMKGSRLLVFESVKAN